MPSDPLFTQSEDAAKPEGAPDTAKATAAPAGFDADAVRSMVTESTAGLNDKVDRLLNTFDNLTQQAAAHQQRQTDSANQIQPDELANELFTNPKTVLRREIDEMSLPLVRETADAFSDNVVRDLQTQVTERFGDKAWTEVFESPIRHAIAEKLQTSPRMLLDRRALEGAVSQLKGVYFDRLRELETEHQTARTKTTEEQEAALVERVTKQIPLTGGLRRISGENAGASLDDEHKSVIAAMEKATGESVNSDRLAKLVSHNRSRGASMDRKTYEKLMGKSEAQV